MYRLNADGTASPISYEDMPEDGAGCFCTVVGCVRHGRVFATPIHITSEQTYDAMTWLRTGEMIPAGPVITIKIEE